MKFEIQGNPYGLEVKPFDDLHITIEDEGRCATIKASTLLKWIEENKAWLEQLAQHEEEETMDLTQAVNYAREHNLVVWFDTDIIIVYEYCDATNPIAEGDTLQKAIQAAKEKIEKQA